MPPEMPGNTIDRADDTADKERTEKLDDKKIDDRDPQEAEATRLEIQAAHLKQAKMDVEDEARTAADAAALAEQIKSGVISSEGAAKTLNASRADYEGGLAIKSARMSSLQGAYSGKGEGFTAEGLMRADADLEDRNRKFRSDEQSRYMSTAEKRNNERPWYKKLLRRGEVTPEDVMREDAKNEDEKFDKSKERFDLTTKLLSGELPLDSHMDALKEIVRERGPSEVLNIFLRDMEKDKESFSTERSQRINQFREVIGKGEYADGFYKQMLLKALVNGWIDTLQDGKGILTGRLGEFNNDRQFVANAVSIMNRRR